MEGGDGEAAPDAMAQVEALLMEAQDVLNEIEERKRFLRLNMDMLYAPAHEAGVWVLHRGLVSCPFLRTVATALKQISASNNELLFIFRCYLRCAPSCLA